MDSSDLSSVYATVNWGDGTTDSTQYPVQSDGSVDGTHDYAEAGNYAVRTAFFDSSGQEMAVVDCLATVADAPLTVTMNPDLQAGFYKNQFFGGEVATFTDSGTDMDPSDYAATINWGDGTSTPDITAGQISAGDGQFTVSDNTYHAYQSAGTFNVTVTVYDDAGASATAEGDVTITVDELGYGGPATPSDAVLTPETGLQAVESTEFGGLEVATFQCNGSYSGPFGAMITWESPDGVPHNSTGTVTCSGGSGTISGGYTYYEAPGYTGSSSAISVTIDKTEGGAVSEQREGKHFWEFAEY